MTGTLWLQLSLVRRGVLALTIGAGLPGCGGDGHSDPVDSGATDTSTGSTGGTDGTTGATNPGPWDPVDEDAGTPASGIQISRVDINQGSAVTLADGAGVVPAALRNAPLIRNREALFRVYWQLEAGFIPREVEARLALYDGAGTQLRVITDTLMVEGAPQDLFVAGAFHFEVNADWLPADVRWSVGLFETGDGSAPTLAPRIPATGQVDLEPWPDPMELRVVLVPIEAGGVAPDPEATADRIREELYQTNPVQAVFVDIAPTQVFSGTPGSVGDAISLVDAVRRADAPAPNVYYHGVLEKGCCGGVGGGFGHVPDATPGSADARISVAKIPEGNDPVMIHSHEVGHTQGLDHAPCGSGAPHIPDYPYGDECRIGAQGYGVLDGALRLQDYSYDYMSYQIGNQWTSDFVYSLNADRIRELTSWDHDGLPIEADPNEPARAVQCDYRSESAQSG